MANVHTLQDINSNKGYRLGNICEQELEESLHHSLNVFDNVNGEKQKLYTHTSELINETKRLKIENADLTSKNIRKELSITESNAENAIKSKKIRSLESMIKILESKLSSAQED
ncbi:15533_t:CDS:2, partial [Entrophospora sp. SA101]